MDVEVSRKDGLILIREMAAEVKNMMDIKMNAVMVSLFWYSSGTNFDVMPPQVSIKTSKLVTFVVLRFIIGVNTD
jgi:hypothetical protein